MNNVWAGASTTTTRQRRTGGRTRITGAKTRYVVASPPSHPSHLPFCGSLPRSLTSSTPFFPPPPHYWRGRRKGEEDVEGEKEEGRGKSARLFVLHPLSLSFCRLGRSMIRSRHSGSKRASEGTAFKTTTTERETVRPPSPPAEQHGGNRRNGARTRAHTPPRRRGHTRRRRRRPLRSERRPGACHPTAAAEAESARAACEKGRDGRSRRGHRSTRRGGTLAKGGERGSCAI